MQALDEYIEHEVRTTEAKASPNYLESFMASYNQQKFTQKIRREAMYFLTEQISRQIRIFTNMLKLERTLEKNPNSMNHILDLAAFCFENEYLN